MSTMNITTRISHRWLERKTKHELASIIMNNIDRISLFAEPDKGVRSRSDAPLTTNITANGELQIHIGIATLAYCFEIQEDNNPYDEEGDSGGFKRLWRVTDAVEFAKAVRQELCRETESGETPLTELLDKACLSAIDDGCLGVEADGRIDPGDDD